MLQVHFLPHNLVMLTTEDRNLFWKVYNGVRGKDASHAVNCIFITRELYDRVKTFEVWKPLLQEPQPVIVWVQWGEEESNRAHEHGIDYTTATKYEFPSLELANAFLKGIDEADGWDGYATEVNGIQTLFTNSWDIKNETDGKGDMATS